MKVNTSTPSKALKEARKQARRQLVEARITAARARSSARAKASRVSAKAVAAAGVVGLVAGYFLRGRGGEPSEAEYRTGQVESRNGESPAEEPASREPSLST